MRLATTRSETAASKGVSCCGIGPAVKWVLLRTDHAGEGSAVEPRKMCEQFNLLSTSIYAIFVGMSHPGLGPTSPHLRWFVRRSEKSAKSGSERRREFTFVASRETYAAK